MRRSSSAIRFRSACDLRSSRRASTCRRLCSAALGGRFDPVAGTAAGAASADVRGDAFGLGFGPSRRVPVAGGTGVGDGAAATAPACVRLQRNSS